ncbi:hypothetical protein TNCV_4332881 [Trichonephila clavipes]|nr:hypothetical protein TNCV_4332881 [Trichonephila clavipes]
MPMEDAMGCSPFKCRSKRLSYNKPFKNMHFHLGEYSVNKNTENKWLEWRKSGLEKTYGGPSTSLAGLELDDLPMNVLM